MTGASEQFQGVVYRWTPPTRLPGHCHGVLPKTDVGVSGAPVCTLNFMPAVLGAVSGRYPVYPEPSAIIVQLGMMHHPDSPGARRRDTRCGHEGLARPS